MSISVDPITHVITIPTADLTLVQSSPSYIYDLPLNDFRMWLKNWEDSEEGIVQLKTHSHNTEVTLGGLTFSRVIEILDPYTITFEDGSYAVNLTGANSNIGDKVNVNSVSVRSQNSAGLISSPAIEYSSFNGGVIIDVNSGNSGTLFPRGTEQMKVNNMSDALLIADYRGFNKVYIHSDITLGADANLDNFIIEGQSNVIIEVIIEDAASVANTVFTECKMSGILDGGNSVTKCIIGDITYLNGHIHDSAIEGKITLDGNEDAFIVNCSQSDIDITPEIDMGGSGQDLIMIKYTGKVLIKNLTGDNTVGIGLDGGVIMLDSTTMTGGTVHVSGTGRLADENGNYIASGTWNGGVTIINELVSNDTILDSQVVYIDTSTSNTGTYYPNGTRASPVNNLSDALEIATLYGINRLHINGTLTILSGEDISGYTLKADSSIGHAVTVEAGAITNSTYFENITVSGVMNGPVRYAACVLGTIDNFDGGAKNCLLTEDITITGSGSNYLTDCDAYVTDSSAYKKITISDKIVNIIRCRGNFEIAGKTSTTTTAIDMVAGNVMIDSDCIAGEIFMDGIVHVIDNSAVGCTVTTDNIVDSDQFAYDTWEALTIDHTTAGTMGKALSDAGSSGNPWATPISGNTTAGTFGELVGKKLLTIAKFLGLK